MTVFTAPDIVPVAATGGLFVAGGISNCPNWQKDIVEVLKSTIDVDIYNPRREIYPSESDAAVKQIEWEYDALHKAGTILFWFPEETLCPITLFELGVFSQRENVTVFVGVHPNYQRKFDVETQLRLARPEINIVYSLEELTEQVTEYYV